MRAYHFWSTTCPPCQRLKPVFADLKEDHPEVTWISVDIHNDPEKWRENFGITHVPSLVCVAKDGTVHKHTGGDAIGYFRLMQVFK
jgi:thiol-disulfide isomerase/thioredoxin